VIDIFPAYYEIILKKIARDTKLNDKSFLEKLSQLRSALYHSRGVDLKYNRERALLYTFFYWPLNFFKYMNLLEQLDKTTDIFERKSIDVADIGCGPGSFYSALIIFLMKKKKKIKVDYLAIDESTENINIFRKYFFNKDFRDFIGFPLRLSLVQADITNFKKARPKDLIVCGDVFSEIREKSDFFAGLKGFMSESKDTKLLIMEPVSRKKNKVFHKESLNFISENNLKEASPCDYRETSLCEKCDYFDTVYFQSPDNWLEKNIDINQADLIYRIIGFDFKGIEVPQNTLNEDTQTTMISRLMMRDIYRKPKPPWRFKVCDGRNGLNHVDILVNDIDLYNRLMNENIGGYFEFFGTISKDKKKKRKSKYVMEIKDFRSWKK